MLVLNTFNFYNFKAILISKLFINFLGNIPKLKRLSFFFIIDIKQYKKNLLLFYIIICLIFGDILGIKKKEVQHFVIFNLNLTNRKITQFFYSFVSFYLPLLGFNQNSLKKGFFCYRKKESISVYRLSYFSFPVIAELDVICADYEMIYGFVNNYRFQLDVHIFISKFLKDSGEILLRFNRLPCNLILRQKYL